MNSIVSLENSIVSNARFLINGLSVQSLSKTAALYNRQRCCFVIFIINVYLFSDIKGTGLSLTPSILSMLPVPKYFAFQVDQLSVLFLLIITGIGFWYMFTQPRIWGGSCRFCRILPTSTCFCLFNVAACSGSEPCNYVYWMGRGGDFVLTCWLATGLAIMITIMWQKAFIMNRIGDLGFLLAIFWILGKLGTVTYSEVFDLCNTLWDRYNGHHSAAFCWGCGKVRTNSFCTHGCRMRWQARHQYLHWSTLLQWWLPVFIWSPAVTYFYAMSEVSSDVVAVVGLATAILAGTIALYQNDIKKVLAYSTVSQLGFMFLALGVEL